MHAQPALSDPPSCRSAPAYAEDALLPVLNRRAYVILDSYNHKRGPVTAPLNVSAILAGLPDAGELGAG